MYKRQSQGLTVADDLRDTLSVTKLLTTSSSAFAKAAGYDLTTYEKEEGDVNGPFALAVAISDTVDDGITSDIVWVSSAALVDDQTNTQVSGGSLEGYLRGLLPVWGDRLWVYLAPIRMLFPVPCPSGVGTPLDETAADALTARHPSHFSPELVCRYCFFRDEDGDAHVFLYDTEETCREKLNLLRRLGVRRVFGEIPQT